MNDMDKGTCPVCYTKMRTVKKTLICPECGYKYCDHNRATENMFDNTHTHEPNYTTYTSAQTSTQYNTGSTPSSHSGSISVSRNDSGTITTKKRSNFKVLKIVIIIYILFNIIPFLVAVLFTIFGATTDNSAEKEVSSSYSQDVENTTLASIDARDGDFFPELIKDLFHTSSWKTVTPEQFGSIVQLDILCDTEGYLYANAIAYDGNSHTFQSKHTDLNLSGIEAFYNLEMLTIDCPTATITNAASIEKLHWMQILILHDNGNIQDFSFLNSLKDLYHLHLETPGLTDISFVENMPWLSTLIISDSARIADLTPLTTHESSLKNLQISFDAETTDYTPLKELTNIEELWVNGNSYESYKELQKDIALPPKDLISSLLMELFKTTDLSTIPESERNKFVVLRVYQNDSGYYECFYQLKNGNADYFYSNCTEFNAANLNLLPRLRELDMPDWTFSQNDLSELWYLEKISCRNTPAELAQIIRVPWDIVELNLTLPEDTTSLEGLETFVSLENLSINAENTVLTDATAISTLSNLEIFRYTDSGVLTDFSFLDNLSNLSIVELNTPEE